MGISNKWDVLCLGPDALLGYSLALVGYFRHSLIFVTEETLINTQLSIKRLELVD